MFWSKNKKNTDKRQNAKGDAGKGKNIRDQALANARQARAAIGDDTLDKIAEIMAKKQNSSLEKARAAAAKDPDKALDEVLFMLKSKT